MSADSVVEFEAALRARDIIPPADLIADGKLRRCDAAGRNGKGDAAYILFDDDFPAGGFQNWRDGKGWENWRADAKREFTTTGRALYRQRMAEAQIQRDEDERQRYADAADRAAGIWRSADTECNGHPYLEKKHLGSAHGARLYRDTLLVVPVRDLDGTITSLQFIDQAGTKRFLTGGRTREGCCVLGELSGDVIIVGESFSTAATLYEATYYPVVIAFSAGNLPAVAAAVGQRFPAAKIIVAADDDHRRPGNPGLTKAREAAALVGGVVAVPDFGPDRPDHFTDFNDLGFFASHDRVREIIDAAVDAVAYLETPPAPVPQSTAVTFSGDGPVASPEPPWPVMRPEAYHGLAGEAVDAIAPHTEADPVGLLAHFLLEFGNAIGRTAYVVADGALHFSNEFALTVGLTSKGRKGTTARRVEQIMGPVDHDWYDTRVLNGLSSGEGVVHEVRDAVRGPDKKSGEEIVIDEGVTDKRLLVHESEFAGALEVTKRHGNTLSRVIREAWDGGKLGFIVKNNRERATGAHISILGHITIAEYRLALDRTSMINGFANRFLNFLVRRAQELPFGGMVTSAVLIPLADRFRQVIAQAPSCEITFDPTARELWIAEYHDLSAEYPGLYGAITARAEAHAVRLALIYALLDQQRQIGLAHLEAALAVWDYCAASARYIFGDALGDPVADTILHALRLTGPDGLTRTEISSLFDRNQSSDRISSALQVLFKHGKARRLMRANPSGHGRPLEIWIAAE